MVANSKYEGEASVTNSGTVEAYSLGASSAGLAAIVQYGTATVDNSGGVYVGGAGVSVGIVAGSKYYSSNATITNSGTIESTSYYADAIGAAATGGYADVSNSGDVTVNATLRQRAFKRKAITTRASAIRKRDRYRTGRAATQPAWQQ